MIQHRRFGDSPIKSMLQTEVQYVLRQSAIIGDMPAGNSQPGLRLERTLEIANPDQDARLTTRRKHRAMIVADDNNCIGIERLDAVAHVLVRRLHASCLCLAGGVGFAGDERVMRHAKAAHYSCHISSPLIFESTQAFGPGPLQR